jgi:diadenosine tetraphosphate (Ap4A) HIT family hydrolase
MAESPEDLHARVVADVGPDGRLPMTPAVAWDVFPWEVVGGQIVPKMLAPPLEVEAPREGEDGGKPCSNCAGDRDDRRIWENDAWVLRVMPRGGLPLILMLETKEHLDFTDLDDEQVSEMGRLSLWTTRIMESLDNTGRVHVMRIGDGAEHLHLWHIARPERFAGILGSFAVEWDDMLPPTPEESWLADQRTVAAKLALHDGRAIV